MPTLTHHLHSVDCHFDCGYGKMKSLKTNAAKGYSGYTMAAEAGSGHPFITKDTADAAIAKWRLARKPQSWIDQRQEIFKDFVFPQFEYMSP